jgi:hypothetical protein
MYLEKTGSRGQLMGRGTPHRGRILPAHRIFHELVFEYRLRLKCPGVMLTWRAFPDCLNISWGGKKLPGYGSAPKWPMPGKAKSPADHLSRWVCV